jgi:ParB family chromosome partitioning protein
MSKKVGVDLSNLFSGAEYSQEVYALESKIAELSAEIEQLRSSGSQELEAKIQELREQLASGSVLDVLIEQIDRNVEQPRQTFTQESIEMLALSLESDGQQEPIILIEQLNGRYLLFDGERRWRSAKLLNWKTIKAVVIPYPAALHRRVLLANLHREDLNPLDTAEALIKEITSNSDLNGDEIPKILRTGVRRLERQGTITKVSTLVIAPIEQQQQELATLGLSEAERIVFQVLLSLQLNPASVNTNIFPMMGLSVDLKQAIREQGLGGMQAKALQQLSSKKLGLSEAAARKVRSRVTKQVLEKKLSVTQVRQLVTAEIARHNQQSDSATGKKQVDGIIQRVRSMPIEKVGREQLALLKEALQQKLQEIDSVLSENG